MPLASSSPDKQIKLVQVTRVLSNVFVLLSLVPCVASFNRPGRGGEEEEEEEEEGEKV